MDFSWNWWIFRGFFVELVDFSWIFRGTGGFFVDFSSKWWFFRGFFVKVVVFLLTFRRNCCFCSLTFHYLGVTLENEAYMLGHGGVKKRKC